MNWFRFYTSVAHDPKVQRLPPPLFKHWVTILCLAGEADNDGILPETADIAFVLRLPEKKTSQIIRDLVDAGLIDAHEDGTFQPHNWGRRQFASDNVSNRVKKHREKRSGNVPGNDDETLHVTPPEQNRTETELTPIAPEPETPKNGRSSPGYTEDFLAFWKAYPSGHGNKQTAFQVWRKLKPDAELQAAMLVGLERWKRSRRWKDGFVKDAERFLKLRMWEDEVEAAPMPPLPADLQRRVDTVDAEHRYRNEPTGVYPEQLQHDINAFYAKAGVTP